MSAVGSVSASGILVAFAARFPGDWVVSEAEERFTTLSQPCRSMAAGLAVFEWCAVRSVLTVFECESCRPVNNKSEGALWAKPVSGVVLSVFLANLNWV
jgi:hypothetical protein